jgi:aminotransferase
MDEHVATFQTFSKSYAMAGYRLGYVAAPPKLAQAIVKTHIYSTICAPTFSQMLGIKALSLQKMYITKMVNEYRKRRDYIYKRLNEIGLHTAKPEGAFYTFSNIGNKNSQRFAKKLLAKAHVATIPGSEFGSYGDGYIRCSYATRLEKISIAMDRLEKYLRR